MSSPAIMRWNNSILYNRLSCMTVIDVCFTPVFYRELRRCLTKLNEHGFSIDDLMIRVHDYFDNKPTHQGEYKRNTNKSTFLESLKNFYQRLMQKTAIPQKPPMADLPNYDSIIHSLQQHFCIQHAANSFPDCPMCNKHEEQLPVDSDTFSNMRNAAHDEARSLVHFMYHWLTRIVYHSDELHIAEQVFTVWLKYGSFCLNYRIISSVSRLPAALEAVREHDNREHNIPVTVCNKRTSTMMFDASNDAIHPNQTDANQPNSKKPKRCTDHHNHTC
jgi:hypothetical protein